MHTLDGKVALVSGSGRGIGRAIAEKLASAGAHLVVNDLDEAVAHEVASSIRATGARATAVVGDVTKTDFANRFVQAAIADFGGIDIIVNNAGFSWDAILWIGVQQGPLSGVIGV